MFRGMGKGFLLLMVTNIAVMVMLLIAMNLLQAAGILPHGHLADSLILCFFYGMGIALVSLAMSRIMVKYAYGVQVIDPNNPGQYDWLVHMVHNQAKAANLPAMPEVGVYDRPELNAFATGPTRSRSLVAFSTGLLRSMSRDEVEGVSAHEVAHIQNGDMLAMTLLQGVVNAFVIFFSAIIARAVASRVDNAGARVMVHLVVQIVAQILFMFIASFIVAAFSRFREYRADAGSARLAGRNKMIAALKALERNQGMRLSDDDRLPEGVAALGISGRPSKFALLLASHPPIEKRIEALEKMTF